MNPSTGTFTSMDTYAGENTDPVSLHKYLFANSNPVKYCDPTGHFSLLEGAMVGAMMGMTMSAVMQYDKMLKGEDVTFTSFTCNVLGGAIKGFIGGLFVGLLFSVLSAIVSVAVMFELPGLFLFAKTVTVGVMFGFAGLSFRDAIYEFGHGNVLTGIFDLIMGLAGILGGVKVFKNLNWGACGSWSSASAGSEAGVAEVEGATGAGNTSGNGGSTGTGSTSGSPETPVEPEVPLEPETPVNPEAPVENTPIEEPETFDPSDFNGPEEPRVQENKEYGGSNSVDIELKYKDGWTAEQKAEADAKVKALSNAKTVKIPVNRGGTSALSRYKSVYGKTSVPHKHDVDHTIDLQLGGEDNIFNMNPLDESVNRSLGVQIKNAIKSYPDGTVFGNFTIQ